MRYLLFFLVFLNYSFATTTYTLKTITNANVRECQSVDCKFISSIKSGQVFKTTKFDKWYKIENRYYNGWVSPLSVKVIRKIAPKSKKIINQKKEFDDKNLERDINKMSALLKKKLKSSPIHKTEVQNEIISKEVITNTPSVTSIKKEKNINSFKDFSEDPIKKAKDLISKLHLTESQIIIIVIFVLLVIGIGGGLISYIVYEKKASPYKTI